MSKIIEDLGIVIAAGGSGSRYSAENSKLLVEYNSVPLFIYTLKNFIDLCPSENFIVVAKDNECAVFADLISKYIPTCGIKVIPGGKTRMHSVYNGLKALSESAKFAAIHDAARPMATGQLLLDCLEHARIHDGAVVAKRLTNTIKRGSVDDFIVENVDRNNLWAVETPQIFNRKDLINAYKKAFEDGIEVTDDSGVMEYSGFKPFLFEHKHENLKITFIEDLQNG